jgi:hypothetical protein
VVKVFNLTNCKLKNNLVGHTGYINTVTVSPDGSLCASGGKVCKELGQLLGHARNVWAGLLDMGKPELLVRAWWPGGLHTQLLDLAGKLQSNLARQLETHGGWEGIQACPSQQQHDQQHMCVTEGDAPRGAIVKHSWPIFLALGCRLALTGKGSKTTASRRP